MTPSDDDAVRDELERQIRDDHHRGRRDRPRGLGCLVISGSMVLSTIAVTAAIVLLLRHLF